MFMQKFGGENKRRFDTRYADSVTFLAYQIENLPLKLQNLSQTIKI